MKQYRVIVRDSSYFGKVGKLLDKTEARRRCAGRIGRGDSWYSYWDILLVFTDDPRDTGSGFQWVEVEEA